MSFVIDKDYTEWGVLARVFPKARILLCQYHVIACFELVVTSSTYAIPLSLRKQVYAILRAAVYVKTVHGYDALVTELTELLGKICPEFLRYFSKRWTACRGMWSDCARGSVFTALNSTTNRLESSWSHLKRQVRRRTRIDFCVEAVFVHQTIVLAREFRIKRLYFTRSVLRARCSPFISWVAMEVSEYCARIIADKHAASTAQELDFVVISASDPCSGVFNVVSVNAEGHTYDVDSISWTCTCNFAIVSGLPCRHMIHVARVHLRLPRLPMQVVRTRWSMTSAFHVMSTLEQGAREIQSLRTGLLLADASVPSRAHMMMKVDSRGWRPFSRSSAK